MDDIASMPEWAKAVIANMEYRAFKLRESGEPDLKLEKLLELVHSQAAALKVQRNEMKRLASINDTLMTEKQCIVDFVVHVWRGMTDEHE